MPYRTFPVELIPRPRGLGPNPVARSGAPIALASKVTSIADNTVRTFDSGALNPGNRFAYWIDEIRMLGFSNVSTSANSTQPQVVCPGTLLRLKLHAGRHDLSKVFVPMWSYTPSYASNGVVDDVGITSIGNGATNGAQYSCAFRWVLPKPLLMLPGESLGGQVQRIDHPGTSGGVVDAIPFNAVLSFVGRANAPGYKLPKKRNVPWVGFETASKAQPDAGTNTALPAPVVVQIGDSFRNPFTRQWVVQRFIMRPYNQWDDDGVLAYAPSYSSVYAEDSLGYAVTPRDCPASVFVSELGSASWTYSRALLAREQMNMRITFPTDIWDGDHLTPEFPNYAAVDASMVGYREEDL